MSSISLHTLSSNFTDVKVEYKDIVNYEIARENICSYIFHLSRLVKNCDPKTMGLINEKLDYLIYIRDNLQIEDFESIIIIFKEIIPEYKLLVSKMEK